MHRTYRLLSSQATKSLKAWRNELLSRLSSSSSSSASAVSSNNSSSSSLPPILTCHTVADMRLIRQAMDDIIRQRYNRSATVGFVPTMGALHTGHLQLIDTVRTNTNHHLLHREKNTTHSNTSNPIQSTILSSSVSSSPADFVISSVFVNPTQFAPHEDLAKYPRTLQTDTLALQSRNVDVVYAPSASEMYPPYTPFRSFLNVSAIDQTSPEGGARPGFFRGVATVVTKLFNITQPTHAAFGQKDGIQCIVIRQIIRDLNMPLRMDIEPTVREKDGLAMSSRNIYLNTNQRKAAPAIYQGLLAAKDVYTRSTDGQKRLRELEERQNHRTRSTSSGTLSPAEAETMAQKAAVLARESSSTASHVQSTYPKSELEEGFQTAWEKFVNVLQSNEHSKEFGDIQYITFSDACTGAPIRSAKESTAVNGAVMLSIAVKVGNTRLLDNIMLIGEPNDLGMPYIPSS